MKNTKLQSILFGLILFVSIASFIYINSIQVRDCSLNCGAKQELVEEDKNKGNSELPDVKIFKKLIEKGKELIPAT